MAKRFTDNKKWGDAWFMDLPSKYKLFWIYILDECDHAGIWKVNFKVASFYVGEHLEHSEVLRIVKDRVIVLNNEYWFIKKFIKFQQNVDIQDLNSKNNAHKGIINILKNFDITRGLLGASEGLASPPSKSKGNGKSKEGAIKNISSAVQEMATKYLKHNREQVDLIQMNVLRQKNDKLFKDLLWAFCLEQIGKVNEHTSYSDFVSHVWNWFNHESFNAEKKLKLIKS